MVAYEEKTGLEVYYQIYTQLSRDQYEKPEIEFDWNEDDVEALSRKFPLLWARYGENPLG